MLRRRGRLHQRKPAQRTGSCAARLLQEALIAGYARAMLTLKQDPLPVCHKLVPTHLHRPYSSHCSQKGITQYCPDRQKAPCACVHRHCSRSAARDRALLSWQLVLSCGLCTQQHVLVKILESMKAEWWSLMQPSIIVQLPMTCILVTSWLHTGHSRARPSMLAGCSTAFLGTISTLDPPPTAPGHEGSR